MAASSFFARELDPATALVGAFIDNHRERFGVEPICRVLTEHGVKIDPSSYYAVKTHPPSARARRDAQLLVQIHRAR